MNRCLASITSICLAWAGEPMVASARVDAGLATCIEQLRRELPRHAEIRSETFDVQVLQATDLRPLIEAAARSQPEFKLAIWDYVAGLADAQRETDGREVLRRESRALAAIEARHGVDAATVVAVFGVETDYGRVKGRYPVVDATLSRACLDLSSDERKRHFFSALWLLQEGMVERESFLGSWAGAFGLTQFMPGTFVRYRDDGDDNGRTDIFGSVPDALGTTARYLAALGWQSGAPWGWEVKVPQGMAATLSARQADHGCLVMSRPEGRCLKLARWSTLGATRIDGRPMTGDATAALLMPAGVDGPAWLVTQNFQALWQYNRSDAYALAIGLLANALRGEPPLRSAWPTDDPGLSRAELRELQTLLVGRGYVGLDIDGADGPRTRTAVADAERSLGMAVSAHPGMRILSRLRAESAPPATADAASATTSNQGAAPKAFVAPAGKTANGLAPTSR